MLILSIRTVQAESLHTLIVLWAVTALLH